MITGIKRHSPAGPARQRPLLAFTLIELLTVISIIAVVAGLVVGLAPVASGKMKEARVRSELAALVTTIESYKSRFGVYPPDNFNAVTGQTDPARNPLYYELTGVLVDNSERVFYTSDDETRVLPATVDGWFRREGFVNGVSRIRTNNITVAAQNRLDQLAKRRLFSRDFRDNQFAEVFRSTTQPGYVDIELLAVGCATDASKPKGKSFGFPWPLKISDANQHPIPSNPGLNPWRYVSTNPTNNPNSFDLWAEIPLRVDLIRDTPPLQWRITYKIIGNWKGETVAERIVP